MEEENALKVLQAAVDFAWENGFQEAYVKGTTLSTFEYGYFKITLQEVTVTNL